MTKPKAKLPALGSHLEWTGNKIRVVVRVPRPLVKTLGKTKLKEMLPTASPREAEVLKWTVLKRLKARINDPAVQPRNALVERALAWREALRDDDPHRVDDAMHALDIAADEVLLKYGEAGRNLFTSVATGVATPLDTYVDQWVAEKKFSGRAEAAYRHALKLLNEWCGTGGTAATIEAISKKIAGRFVTEQFISRGSAAATTNKAVTALSSYWQWLGKRGHIDDQPGFNPWAGQSVAKGERRGTNKAGADDGDSKRPFTNDEVSTLLKGIVKQPLADFCMVAALTGMRRDEIANLKVKHIRDRMIHVPGTKSAAALRITPLHSALEPLVARRTKGKHDEEFLFHELPDQTNPARGRGAPVSQAFVRERRDLKVDDTVAGGRQSRIDLHSWRRWFISQCVRALENGATGFTAWTIADVVGHSKEEGPLPMTMGRYPGSAPKEALRACVEAVHLPKDEHA